MFSSATWIIITGGKMLPKNSRGEKFSDFITQVSYLMLTLLFSNTDSEWFQVVDADLARNYSKSNTKKNKFIWSCKSIDTLSK